LTELAIVIIARLWTAQIEWYGHAPLARRAGIDDSILQAIARRETPEFINQDEKLVYEFSRELNENKKVSDATYTAAVKEFGAQGVVELVGLLGFYTLVAMTLNTFELRPPDGAEELMPE
jgi:4-carboxymuconolactone decarboxylase